MVRKKYCSFPEKEKVTKEEFQLEGQIISLIPRSIESDIHIKNIEILRFDVDSKYSLLLYEYENNFLNFIYTHIKRPFRVHVSRCIQLLYICSCKTMRAIIVLSAPSSFLHVMLIEQASKILMFRDVSFNKWRRQLKLKQNLKTSKRLTSFVLVQSLLFLYDYRMSQVFHLKIMVYSQLI